MSLARIRRWNEPSQIRHAAVLGLVYLAAAYVAVAFTRFEGGVAMIWIATGILCVDLRHRPQYSWTLRAIVCLIASCVVTSLFGLGIYAAGPIALVNIGEAVACALLLNRFLPGRRRLQSAFEIVVLVAIAGLFVPMLSAFPAAALAHYFAQVPFWSNWWSWVAAHALGSLTVMPLAELLLGGDLSGWARTSGRRNQIEAAILFAATAGITALVFCQDRLPLLFLPFLPIQIAVFRLGRLGAAVGVIILTTVGGALTLQGQGPVHLIDLGVGERVQFFQFYLATALLMSLPAAAELKRRKQLFSRLEESAALYQVIADRTGDILMALEIDGTIRFISPSVLRITGFESSQLIGRKAQDIVFAEDFDAMVSTHRQAIAHPDETFMGEFRAARANGEAAWFETHTRATINGEGHVTGAVSVIREVSGRKAKELDLAKAAVSDPLTGVLNRRGLELIYREQFPDGDARPAGCMAVFDLDHFKSVNDRYGHAVGDDVLQIFASVVVSTVRDTDTVARLGGEEFAVLLVGADLDQAQAVCERVRGRFADMTILARDRSRFSVTVSAGLAVIPADESLESVLTIADVALYEAKSAGRNRLAIAA